MTMTEAFSERIKPPRAAYKETPYESPARIGNGTGEASPFYDKEGETSVAKQARVLGIKSIEEAPLEGNAALIDAVGKIYAAVTRQIAYHERELKRLRESLTPFASISRQNDAPKPSLDADTIRAVLDYADKLPQTGEQTS
jgi:hypothetical protein